MKGVRRTACALVMLAAAATWPAGATAAAPSIAEIEAELAAGTTDCRTVVAEALARISAAESSAQLDAVLELNPQAGAIAAERDGELAAGRAPGPLECVPVLIKDNMQTADRMQTTAGSVTMRGFRAREDAHVVARLRRAGVVIVGKTNMDEWAHGAAGYSSRGGQTHNGLNPLRGPGGSSGGSAAAVAAGLVPVATGSDTGGSIQIPASYNGVVGLRATKGLISRAGIVPYASLTDVAGPLTGSVEDLARVLGPLTGVDRDDPATHASRGNFLRDYTGALDPAGLQGMRVGILTRAFKTSVAPTGVDTRAGLEAAKTALAGAGSTVLSDLPPLTARAGWPSVFKVVARQFGSELNGWLRGPGAAAPVDSLDEVIARSAAAPVRIIDSLRADAGAKAPAGPGYRKAKARTRQLRRAAVRYMDRHDLDALAFAATGCPAPPLPGVVDPTYACDGAEQPLEFADNPGSIAPMLSPATGLPVITVPGAPMPGNQRFGLSLLGRPWSEPGLIAMGYAFELAQPRAG